MIRGDRLKELRQKNAYTFERLAEVLDVSMRQLARYEAGEADPGSGIVAGIADLFDVSADYLLGRTNDPTPCYQPRDITPKEQQILAALRRGDALEAIRRIVAE